MSTVALDQIKSIQPSSYSVNNADVADHVLTFQINMAVIAAVVILIYLFANRKHWFVRLDLYNKQHNHFVDEPM
jgi:hypothetical protein